MKISLFSKAFRVKATLVNDEGIHILPAQMLTAAAKAAKGGIRITCGKTIADAKDIYQVLRLRAGKGRVLTISAENAEDGPVVEKMADLVKEGFGEK